MISTELILLGVAALMAASVLASKASSQTGIPALLLFLLIGMLAGAEGPGRIYLDSPSLVQSVGVVALVLILFSGGLDTSWQAVRPILWHGMTLANLGVVISAAVMGAVVWLTLGYSPLEGLLLGAIVSSTDAAAVFTVLRANGVNLKGNLEPLIEFESGSNDPMAVFLTVGLTGLVVGTHGSLIGLGVGFVWQMALGTVAGYGMGRVITWVVNRMRLSQEGLYPVLTLALVLLTYSLTAVLGGNGFLAVYLAGIVMNGQNFVHKRSLMRFHDGVAWLMQIAMFITLGLQVLPSELLPVIGTGLLMSAALIFVARPVSVFLSLALMRISVREKLVVSWVGLRGAVPIVLATFPLLAGAPHADAIFNIVFFIVISSVLLQGTTIPLVARWLGAQASGQHTFHYPHEFTPNVSASCRLIELTVGAGSSAPGRTIMELGLPPGTLVVSIRRRGESLVPGGGTLLNVDDRVLVLAEAELMETVRAALL
ncbi:potassium/proton antiporter [Chloroflexales bacterium ZM16-3]|nr:potassium/proton antiporter [Chloroflexales bacterium ZM16-3]